MIQVNHLTSIYYPNTPFEYTALENITTTFEQGKFYCIIGHTGSGKSTFIQHLNALMLPTRGEVIVDGVVIDRKTKQRLLNDTRKKVGIVFQFPESQLFEETVIKDVMFGPLNIGFSKEDARTSAAYYLKRLGIPKDKWEDSPFQLSGGQMRKVAIASILSMNQQTIILDEPTAGLDPKSHIEVMKLIHHLNVNEDKTIILVTHNMDDCYEYSDEVKVFYQGSLVAEGETTTLLNDCDTLQRYHLTPPKVVRLTRDLKEKGFVPNTPPRSTEAFIEHYKEWRSTHAK